MNLEEYLVIVKTLKLHRPLGDRFHAFFRGSEIIHFLKRKAINRLYHNVPFKAMLEIQRILRSKQGKKQALDAQRFFKTGEGQYGHGDLFLGGWSSPNLRNLAVSRNYSFEELKILLSSSFHEERMLSLMALVDKFQKTKDSKVKSKIVNFYLKNRKGINNWDLVDVSVYKILGNWALESENPKLLTELLKSKRHWDRRMAIVGTLAFIKAGKLDLTLSLVKKSFEETEDLMHKACGWMLRELGKKDATLLKNFLKQNIKKIPRTTLRYAIEKFSDSERKMFLSL